jgi:hypothetical protein
MYDGHIVPSSFFRHAPSPLHISTSTPHAAEIAVVEPGLWIRRPVRRSEAQVRRQRRRVDDLAGVEEAVGIERLLHRPERVVKHRAEHLLGERSAHHAVAVLARQRAAELEH